MKSKIVFELGPSESNQRNDGPDFFVFDNGAILLVCNHFGSASLDWDKSDIYGIWSFDNGESFGDPFPMILHGDMDADNVMGSAFLKMKNGDAGLFFFAKRGDSCQPYFTRSSDYGKTWSKPIPCIDSEDYFCMNNDRAIYTSRGAILLPLAHHQWKYKEENGERKRDGITKGSLCIIASYDDGESFEVISDGYRLPSYVVTGVQEPGLIELDDGTLWCYIRNSTDRQLQCYSYDGGKTWSESTQSVLTSTPWSPISAKKLSDGRIMVLRNPDPTIGREMTASGHWTGGRTPFVMDIGRNETDFYKPITIESDPNSGYAYTAICELPDKSVLLGYCAGGEGDVLMLNRLRVRKVWDF